MTSKVSYPTLLYYALPALPLALLGLPLYIYLPTFYVSEIGLGVSQVGLLLFFSRLLDMLNDPLIGIITDKTSAHKKLMFLGMLILLMGFYALTHPPKAFLSLWLFSFSLIAYAGWSLITIPYLTLGAKLSDNYHDNTRFSSARESFNIVGLLLALILPYALNIAEDVKMTMTLMWEVIFISLPILLVVSLLGLPQAQKENNNAAFWPSLKMFWKDNKSSRVLFTAFLLNSLANALPATLFLFFVSLVLKAPSWTGGLLILYFLIGIVALPLWLKISKIKGKRFSWIASMALASSAFIFVPFLQEGDLLWFVLITAISGLSLGADMALPASMQADISQKSDFQGHNLSGILFSIWALMTKLSLAMAVGISFGILGLANFEPKAPTEDALFTLSILYGLFPVIFKVAAIWILRSFKEVKMPN